MFWVISVYFNIRNTLPKSGTFILGHSVYTYNCTVHFSKDQLEDGPKIGPKHVAGIII